MKLQELSALIALNAVERSYASVPHASTSIPRHPDFLLTIMFCCFFELVAAVSLLCHENTPWRFYGNLVFSHSRSPHSWKLKLGSRNPHFQKEYDMSVHHETLTPQNPKLSADVLRIFFFLGKQDSRVARIHTQACMSLSAWVNVRFESCMYLDYQVSLSFMIVKSDMLNFSCFCYILPMSNVM